MHDFNKPRRNFDALASQLLPCPNHPILKWTFRFPILFYRLGLVSTVGRLFMFLTTTGLPRHHAIEFYSEVGAAAVVGLMVIAAVVLGRSGARLIHNC